MFKRETEPSERDPNVLVDSNLGETSYVDSFGFEWTHIDGFVGKEVMSHGHVFGRFMLPRNFFNGKSVVDVGCGNGRIGRLIAPLCTSYLGIDLSEAVYAFPKYTQRPAEFKLLRASGTDLPLADGVADVTICWGVLHHMDEPERAFNELMRVTKPGGAILIFVYPESLDARKNLNVYMRGLPQTNAHDIIAGSPIVLMDGERWINFMQGCSPTTSRSASSIHVSGRNFSGLMALHRVITGQSRRKSQSGRAAWHGASIHIDRVVTISRNKT